MFLCFFLLAILFIHLPPLLPIVESNVPSSVSFFPSLRRIVAEISLFRSASIQMQQSQSSKAADSAADRHADHGQKKVVKRRRRYKSAPSEEAQDIS